MLYGGAFATILITRDRGSYRGKTRMLQKLPDGFLLRDQYSIESCLGSGGFGNTYVAIDHSMGVRVAIKEFFPQGLSIRNDDLTVSPLSESTLFDQEREVFLNESRLLSRLTSKSIVRVFGVFVDNGTAYSVMELINGSDLSDWEQAVGRAPNQVDFDAIFEPLVQAIGELHESGVIHRDIKPENIMIRKEGLDPVLLDFGAAIVRGDMITGAVATPSFSPLEQQASDTSLIGPWSDIYSLSATMYYCLTKSIVPATLRAAGAEMQALSSYVAAGSFRPSLLKAIEWGLELASKDRPQTIDEWRGRLFPHLLPSASKSVRRAGATKVFISYRRSDSLHFSGRLYDRLKDEYGSDRIFFDLNTIPIAADFREYIRNSMLGSAVLVSVIGGKWLSKSWAKRPFFGSRIRRTDFVQLEIEQAIDHGVPIVPVLIDGASMPKSNDLPEGMREMLKINAVNIGAGRAFHSDIDELISTFDRLGVPRTIN